MNWHLMLAVVALSAADGQSGSDGGEERGEVALMKTPSSWPSPRLGGEKEME
jgi:hypothetical protein